MKLILLKITVIHLSILALLQSIEGDRFLAPEVGRAGLAAGGARPVLQLQAGVRTLRAGLALGAAATGAQGAQRRARRPAGPRCHRHCRSRSSRHTIWWWRQSRRSHFAAEYEEPCCRANILAGSGNFRYNVN